MGKIAAATIAIALSACGPAALRPCTSACANMIALQCEGAEGSPGVDEIYGTADDVSCAQACAELSEDTAQFFPVGCIEAAPTCEAVGECFAAW